jgi:hypothetical protein
VPSEKAKAFIKKGMAMGFRMMPHFNSIDMDPSHPAYAYLRDFQYRGIERKDLRGWSWYQGRGLGVPESNASRLNNRDKKVMVKVHPGLSMWRSILGQNILQAARELDLDTVFIDVTLVSHNLHNCFVEATTPTEGMKRVIDHVSKLGKGLVVGGSGIRKADVGIKKEQILAVEPEIPTQEANRVIDASGKYVMPARSASGQRKFN